MKLHETDEECPIRTKLAAIRRELTATLIEREEEIGLALTALVTRQHLLLVGPPGCGKSLLLDGLLARLEGGNHFSILLTKFTSVEEVMGPLSLAGLKEDRFKRVTAGRLPEAHVAMMDEIWKASSAILNCLLRILNERTYENDGAVHHAPLLLALGASNEWPDPQDGGRELQAAFDRFLFRKSVRPISTAAGRGRLLWGERPEPGGAAGITPDEVREAHRRAMRLPFSDDARSALEEVLRELAREGVRPGDRRQFQSVRAAKAYAYLDGASHVQLDHLEVLAHTLWDDPSEQPEVVARVIAKVANPAGMRVNGLLLEAEGVLAEADARDLAKSAAAAAKLGEIEKRLAELKGDARAEKARAYVRGQARRIKLASIESI